MDLVLIYSRDFKLFIKKKKGKRKKGERNNCLVFFFLYIKEKFL